MSDVDLDDAVFHGGQERLEAKLRHHVLRAHIRLAEANVPDHILHELAMLALGKKPDGSPLQVEPRTRAQAMGTYLRAVEKAARLGVSDTSVTIDARHQQVIADPATIKALLQPEAQARLCDRLDELEGKSDA